MKKMLNEGNQIHNFIFSSGPGTVINYGPGSVFLTSYGSGSGSTRQKVTVHYGSGSTTLPAKTCLSQGALVEEEMSLVKSLHNTLNSLIKRSFPHSL
jgi:hypothetical protein